MNVIEALATLDEHPMQLALIRLQYPEIGSALTVLANHAREEGEEVAVNAYCCTG